MNKTLAQGSEKHLQIKSNIDKCFSLGAEAILTLKDNIITKNRIKKSYRIQIIDEKLRRSRTKSEAKIIKKLKNIIPVPNIIKTDDRQIIEMQFINGKKLSDSLEKLNYKKISSLIGENISKMHSSGIIHGDLTTSNMIYVSDDISSNKVFFIDFGLAYHSDKIEDKAVDLHLLTQALEAKHYTIYKECIKNIFASYEKDYPKAKEVINRIKVIESRGRYKDKY